MFGSCRLLRQFTLSWLDYSHNIRQALYLESRSTTRRLLCPGGRRLPEVGERDQEQANAATRGEGGAARRFAERPNECQSARLRQKAAEILASSSAVLGKLSVTGERRRKSGIYEV